MARPLLPPRLRSLAALPLGASLALGQAPVFWPLATLAALVAALWLFAPIGRIRAAALFGWLLGGGYFAASLFWIMEPFQVDAARYGWMAPFALGFMAFGLALFWAAGFGLAALAGGGGRCRLWALIPALGLAELARSYVLTGFPWGLIGYVWVETPVMQLAAWVGPHGVGALTLLLAALPLTLPRRGLGLGLSAALLAGAWGLGLARLSPPGTVAPDRPPVRVRLIQPNAPQEQKWDPAYAPVFFRRMLELTAAAPEEGERAPAIVIWPEAAVTWWLGEAPELQALIARTAGAGARVALGIRRAEGRRFYNALAVLDAEGRAEQVYDKVHLVPFGEYVPFGSLLSKIGFYGLAAEEGGGYSAGAEHRLLDFGAAGRAVPLICYEAIFPHLAAPGAERADWLLQVTNDAWFGRLAGPQQHLAQARVRAIEQGLPMLRVANTGISAVIDANGRILDRLPLGVAGRIDADLPAARPAPFYSRSGDWPMLALHLLALAAAAFRGRRESH